MGWKEVEHAAGRQRPREGAGRPAVEPQLPGVDQGAGAAPRNVGEVGQALVQPQAGKVGGNDVAAWRLTQPEPPAGATGAPMFRRPRW